MTNLQIVVFNMIGEICGAEIDQVKQIIQYQKPSKTTEMPQFIEGTINLREIEVPIIDLNKRLDFGESVITNSTKILLIEINNKSIGFIVNDVKELLSYTEDDVETLPAIINEAGNIYMTKVVKRDEEIISILDLHLLLSESQLKELNT